MSTWLNGGVPLTTVAGWAGHSVEVLLKIYAKCLDRTDTAIQRRVLDALGHNQTPTLNTPTQTQRQPEPGHK